jgi:hypothetical protein
METVPSAIPPSEPVRTASPRARFAYPPGRPPCRSQEHKHEQKRAARRKLAGPVRVAMCSVPRPVSRRNSRVLLPALVVVIVLSSVAPESFAHKNPAPALDADDFRYRTYAQTNADLQALALTHPAFVHLTTATTAAPATCRTIHGMPASCKTLVVELGFRPIPPDSPAVLILGPVHGDERVAASAAVGLITLFARRSHRDPWVSRLLRTRRIIVVPLPNSAAYDQGVRVERQMDGTPPVEPTTDFPFARTNISEPCMLSSASRVVDELFAKYTFVVALQLQEAEREREALLYSWGSQLPSMCGSTVCKGKIRVPDHIAYSDVAGRMAAFAGPSHLDNEMLQHGAINDISSPSGGAFVDYAYASSFLAHFRSNCGTSVPSNISHRAISFVIEAVRRETKVNEFDLGRLGDMYLHSSRGNVVTRVLRAALVAIDVASPYVFFMRGGQEKPVVRGGIVHIRWSVGGAVTVDRTFLTCRLEDGQPWTTPIKSGKSMWASSFEDRSGLRFFLLNELSNAVYEFRTSLILFPRLTAEQRANGARLYIRAHAVVDQGWAAVSPLSTGYLGPQSHLVQLRTNLSWLAKNPPGNSSDGTVTVSSPTWVINVPAVSGIFAFLELIWEFVLLIALVSCGPPMVFFVYSQRLGASPFLATSIAGATLRKRLRRSVNALSRAEIAAEARRLRRGTSNRLSHIASSSSILGIRDLASFSSTSPVSRTRVRE